VVWIAYCEIGPIIIVLLGPTLCAVTTWITPICLKGKVIVQ
jgi:hypothetical protein